jgi:hypothetical protein
MNLAKEEGMKVLMLLPGLALGMLIGLLLPSPFGPSATDTPHSSESPNDSTAADGHEPGPRMVNDPELPPNQDADLGATQAETGAVIDQSPVRSMARFLEAIQHLPAEALVEKIHQIADRGLFGNPPQFKRYFLIAALSERDPERMLSLITDNSLKGTYFEGRYGLFATWATIDPDTAIEKLSTLEDSAAKVIAATGFLMTLSETDPGRAYAFHQKFGLGPMMMLPDYYQKSLFRHWAELDP